MSSGRCWNRCSTRPASADLSTHRTCGRWWTRCCMSATRAASGATCPSRSGRGCGCGGSCAAGQAAEPGRVRRRCCTRPPARPAAGGDATGSMVVIDTHLACGASNGGFTFHDRGGPYGAAKSATGVVALEVTGLPVGALVAAASTHEYPAGELMLEHLTQQGPPGDLSWSWWTVGSARPLPSARAAPRPGDAPGRVGRQAAGAAPHPAPLARRGRPWPPRTLPRSCEVVREHHRLGDRLAPGRLHHDHPAPPNGHELTDVHRRS
jgi:hypothetical protein